MSKSKTLAIAMGKKRVPVSKTTFGAEHLTDDKFRSCFNEMRIAGEMTDVEIAVEDRDFPAHKLILAGCSPYFRGMFRGGNFDESSSARIQIDPKGDLGIKADAVEQLIIYVYTGHVEISHHNVIDLIRAADLLELTEVKHETLNVIAEHINLETYLDIREVSIVFNCPRLLETVDKFIRKNFSEFAKTGAFLELSEHALIAYLQHDLLRTDSEEVVFRAVVRWCKENDCLDKFSEFARYLRFNLLSFKFLAGILREDMEIRAIDAVSNTLLDKMQSLTTTSNVSRPRFSTHILVAFPYRSSNFFRITFYGDQVEFTVKEIPTMIREHIDALVQFAVTRVGDNHLYLAGGTGFDENNESFQSDRGYIFDLVNNEWTASTPLPSNLNSFSATSIGEMVYLIGGDATDGGVVNEVFSRVDFRLPLKDREWTPLPKTTFERTAVTLVSMGQYVYAIGGMQDGGYSSTVERFDTTSGNWEVMDTMLHARCQAGYTVAHGKIYVVGGLGDNLIGPPGGLKSVEFFDPQLDAWTGLPDMYFSRHAPAVTFMKNKLYVFGGGSPAPLLKPGPEKTVECFDFERFEWFVQQVKIPGRANAVYESAFFDNLDT